MKYTNFVGKKISRLGFGLMRLPTINENNFIDYKKSKNLIEYAYKCGINYFDTAYPYHDGQSEIFTGEVLSSGLREKIFLATKHPVWLIEKPEDFEYYLNIQLKKLQTDYIDFYLLHALDRERWMNLKKHNIYERMKAQKESGKIRAIGFSFHDDLELFKEIIDTYDFDFCQLQLNYLDENYQAGLEGLKYAKSKGLNTIIMEPLRGGTLANLPDSISKNIDSTPASLGFSYLFNMDEVDIVLSGMNEIEQIKENAEIADRVTPNSLTKEKFDEINYLKSEMNSRIKIDCTRCKYCMPCPHGVDIPETFKIYNGKYMFEDEESAIKKYAELIKDKESPKNCVECGSCEHKCPQSLPIIENLKLVHKELFRGEK